jgi:hypothetical protein
MPRPHPVEFRQRAARDHSVQTKAIRVGSFWVHTASDETTRHGRGLHATDIDWSRGSAPPLRLTFTHGKSSCWSAWTTSCRSASSQSVLVCHRSAFGVTQPVDSSSPRRSIRRRATGTTSLSVARDELFSSDTPPLHVRTGLDTSEPEDQTTSTIDLDQGGKSRARIWP